MKDALALHFSSLTTPEQAQQHVVRVRFAEALARQSALTQGNDEEVHAFRLACKRLRFAIERLENPEPSLQTAAKILGRLTDELGGAHDCAELAKLASECGAPLVTQRALHDRDRYVTRAARLWRRAFREEGAFAALATYAGFTWSTT